MICPDNRGRASGFRRTVEECQSQLYIQQSPTTLVGCILKKSALCPESPIFREHTTSSGPTYGLTIVGFRKIGNSWSGEATCVRNFV